MIPNFPPEEHGPTEKNKATSEETREGSPFKNVDFEAPIVHNHESDVEGEALSKQQQSGDIR